MNYRVCASKGQLPRLILFNFEPDPSVLFQRRQPSLLLRMKCQEIVSRCFMAVIENGVRVMSVDRERALDILLRTFESQINEFESQAMSGMPTQQQQQQQQQLIIIRKKLTIFI